MACLSADMPSDTRFSPRLLSACSYRALACSRRTSASLFWAADEHAATSSARASTAVAGRLDSSDLQVLPGGVPTYEYECDRCKRTFEVRQRISEPPLTTCDQCGGSVRRLLAPAAFILKGEGWYVTDYPSESRKKAKEAESGSTKPGAPATSSSGDGQSSTAPAEPSPSSSSPAATSPSSSSGSSASSGSSSGGSSTKPA